VKFSRALTRATNFRSTLKADIRFQPNICRDGPAADVNLLDDLVRAGEQRRWNGETESRRCLEGFRFEASIGP
jgi:hypothetical protein